MVNAMTSYAEDRARYDTTYIRGVYASVEAASSQFKISTNATWPGVATALGDVRACLSIDANVSRRPTPASGATGRRRRRSSARARGPAAPAPGVALCREVEGHWRGARPRGVGRAVGAVAAGRGVRAPLILRIFFRV